MGASWGLDLKSGRDVAEEEDTWVRPSAVSESLDSGEPGASRWRLDLEPCGVGAPPCTGVTSAVPGEASARLLPPLPCQHLSGKHVSDRVPSRTLRSPRSTPSPSLQRAVSPPTPAAAHCGGPGRACVFWSQTRPVCAEPWAMSLPSWRVTWGGDGGGGGQAWVRQVGKVGTRAPRSGGGCWAGPCQWPAVGGPPPGGRATQNDPECRGPAAPPVSPAWCSRHCHGPGARCSAAPQPRWHGPPTPHASWAYPPGRPQKFGNCRPAPPC